MRNTFYAIIASLLLASCAHAAAPAPPPPPIMQVPVTVTPTPHQQFLDANGKPLAGGLVFTYAAGTTTPAATYTDFTGTAVNTNPIVLDGGGYANIWLAAASYKFVVQDSTGALQWAVDGVTSTQIYAPCGTNGQVQYKSGATFGCDAQLTYNASTHKLTLTTLQATNITATNVTLTGLSGCLGASSVGLVGNASLLGCKTVIDYGADPTGTVNSKAAFDLAATHCHDNGALIVPPGTYLYDTGIAGSGTGLSLPSCTLQGAGRNISILKRKLTASASYNGIPLIHNQGWKSVGDTGITIRDITIDNGQASTSGVSSDYNSAALTLQGVTSVTVQNVAFQNCDPGTKTFVGAPCIGGWAWNDVWIENNTFSNWCPGNCGAIYPQFSNASGLFASTISRGIHILHNDVDGSASGSHDIKIYSYHGGTAGKVQELEIVGNKLTPSDGRRTFSGVAVTGGSATISGIPGGNFTSDMAMGTAEIWVMAAGTLNHITSGGTAYGPFTVGSIQCTAGAGTLVTTGTMYAQVGSWIQITGTVNYNNFYKITGATSGTAFTFACAGTTGIEVVGTINSAPVFHATVATVNSPTSVTLSSPVPTTNASTTIIWSDAAAGVELFTGGDPTVINGFTVAENIITGAGPIGAANPNISEWCLSIAAAVNGVVSNNSCNETHLFGIETVGTFNVAVTGNTLVRAGQSTVDANDANNVMQPLTGNTWTGNTFRAPVLSPIFQGSAVMTIYDPALNANAIIKDLKITGNNFQLPVSFDVLAGTLGAEAAGGAIEFNCLQFAAANTCVNPTIVSNTFAGNTASAVATINVACCGTAISLQDTSNAQVALNHFHDIVGTGAQVFSQDSNSGKTKTRFLLNDFNNVVTIFTDGCTVGCHTLGIDENPANDDLMVYLRPDGTGINLDFCMFASGTCPGNYDIFSFVMNGGQPVLSMVDQAGHTFLQFDSSASPPVLNMNFSGSTCGIAGCVAFRKATTTVGALPACDATHANEELNVTDSNTNTWGAVIAGGGANNVQARCNGTNWTVVGK